MEKIEAPASDDKKVSFRFPQPQRSGQRVIRMIGQIGMHDAFNGAVGAGAAGIKNK